MTITALTIPTYPVPARVTKVRFSATHGNYIRFYLTSCPPDSEWYAGFRGGDVAKQLKGEVDATKDLSIVFDKPGVYTFSAEELTKGASDYGGSYLGDPDSYDTLTRIGASTIYVRIGQRMTYQLGAGNNTAFLNIYVWDTTCRATTSDYHGEVTPSIDRWTSDKARLASLDATVVAALASFVDATSTAILGAIATLIDEAITKQNAHLSQATVHASNDTDNAIDISYKLGSSTSVARMAAAMNKLHQALSQHMTNNSGAGPGSATTDYHTAADNKRAAISDGASDMRTVINSYSDWRRIYEAHRVEGTTIHANADTTNTLTAAPPLVAIAIAFLNQLSTTSPTVPATEQSAVAALMALGGFEKS